jgi:cytoskeletal protein CcmA (bactofilin family)
MAQLANLRAAHAPGHERSTQSGELVIGRGIQVKGQIGACKTLVVEGELDASVEVQTLLLLEGGLFKGTAVVDYAELAGRLEGKLTVQGKLHLKASARASGEIRYRRIVIEEGGEISGDISVLPAEKESAAAKPEQVTEPAKTGPEAPKASRSLRR